MATKFLILSLLILSTSCKKQNKDDDSDAQEEKYSKVGREFQSGSQISNTQFNIAVSICNAFESKKEYYWGGPSRNDKFKSFYLEIKDCAGNTSKYDNVSATVMAPLYQAPYYQASASLISDIPTDEHGDLSSICDEVLATNPTRPTSTYEPASGTKKYKRTFTSEQNKLIYGIETYKYYTNSGKWLSYMAENNAVYIDENSTKNGIITIRRKDFKCNNGNEGYTLQRL